MLIHIIILMIFTNNRIKLICISDLFFSIIIESFDIVCLSKRLSVTIYNVKSSWQYHRSHIIVIRPTGHIQSHIDEI